MTPNQETREALAKALADSACELCGAVPTEGPGGRLEPPRHDWEKHKRKDEAPVPSQADLVRNDDPPPLELL